MSENAFGFKNVIKISNFYLKQPSIKLVLLKLQENVLGSAL
jgi:hypothetical protein